MSEEVNRILTDRVSSLLFCPTMLAVDNLSNEGFANWKTNAKVILSGDVMRDRVIIYKNLAQQPINMSISNDYDVSELTIVDPVGYLNMVWLIENCSLVMTDSGGLQKEAFFFAKPCVSWSAFFKLHFIMKPYNSVYNRGYTGGTRSSARDENYQRRKMGGI